MHLLRTKFKNGIVAEFLPPKHESNKVIILCDGLPALPHKKKVLDFFSKKGYWVFHPRYKGTWESSGEFLVESPEQGILEIVDEFQTGFYDVWNNIEYRVKFEKIFVVGSSFGGAVALMCARDARVNKIVAFSPAVDFTAESEEEPLETYNKRIKEAFGEAYRFSSDNWQKFKSGEFFNPVNNKEEIDGKKVLMFCTKDDKITHYKPAERFAVDIGANFVLKEKGGHLSISNTLKWRYWRKIKKFLK